MVVPESVWDRLVHVVDGILGLQFRKIDQWGADPCWCGKAAIEASGLAALRDLGMDRMRNE